MSPATSDPDRPVDRPAGGDRSGAASPAPYPGPEPSSGPDPAASGLVTPTAPGAAHAGTGPAPLAPAAGPSPAPVAAGDGRRNLLVAGVAALVLTLLGAPLGLLWTALAPPTPVVKAEQGAVYAQTQPEQPIAADGWFSLLGLGFGILAALALWFLLRRQRGPLGLLGVVVGCLGAAVVAWQLGRRIGLSTYQRLLESAPVGQTFDKPVDLRAGGVERLFGVVPSLWGDLLLAAFGAAVTYTLLAGWSRWPSLRPEPEPDLSWVSSAPAGSPTGTTAPEPPAPGATGPSRG